MGLSSELISQFAKLVNKDTKQPTETTIYGTVTIDANENLYVQPDGSDQLIPISLNDIITENDKDPETDTEGDSDTGEDAEEGTDTSTKKKSTTADIKSGDRVSVLIKNHTATVTGNITSPSTNGAYVDGTIAANNMYLKELIAEKVNVTQLEAAKADIEKLEAENANITGKLTAAEADIVKLTADTAKIGQLEADNVTINGRLDAAVGAIDNLTSENANITGKLTAAEANIKNLTTMNIDASRINAGTINTNYVNIGAKDINGGGLIIFDNTIQISDGNVVRMQMGKDAAGTYSFTICDEDGKVLYNEDGITDNAIPKNVIRDDMIRDDANINGKKIDMTTLFIEMNGSAETLKASKIYYDSKEQTLDVLFQNMSSDVEELEGTIITQETAISVMQGKIDEKISQQDLDTATGEMDRKVSRMEKSIEGIRTTVSSTVIGGRNLLKHTGDFPITYDPDTGIGENGFSRALTQTADGVRYDISSLPGDTNNGFWVPFAYDGIAQNGSTVTISFYYRGTVPGFSISALSGSNNVAHITTVSDMVESEEEWEYYTKTFDMSWDKNELSSSNRLRITPTGEAGVDGGKWFEVRKRSLKLERGHKATDWCPSQEELASTKDLESVTSTFSERMSTLETTANGITAAVSSVETIITEKLDDNAKQISDLRKDVALKMTPEDVGIEISNVRKNGVEKVETTTGFTFDEHGLTIEKTNGKTNTKITENGMTVNSNATNLPVLTANKDGVDAQNLHASTYLIIGGNSRFENYINNGTTRTACFWIGG